MLAITPDSGRSFGTLGQGDGTTISSDTSKGFTMNLESVTGPKEKMVAVTVLPTAARSGSDKVVLKFKA